MKLIEMHIVEFGCLKQVTLTPHGGLTIIEGDNETGKSTVLLFIKFMLYGLPKRGSAERERSVSRDGHRAAGTMTLSVDGEEYRIERAYSDGGRGSEKKTVYRLRDGAAVCEGVEPGEALLGVPREIFESSCLVGQLQCAAIGGKKEVAAIRNLLTSADESVDLTKIEKRLEDIRVLYRHKKGEGGRLYELERKINEEQRRLTAAYEARERAEELSAALEKQETQARETAAKLERAETVLTECNRAEILGRFDALHEAERHYERACLDREGLTERYRFLREPTAAEGARLSMLADSLERAEADEGRWAQELERLDGALCEVSADAEAGERVERTGGSARVLSALKRGNTRRRAGVSGLVVGAVALAIGGTLLGVSATTGGVLLFAGLGLLGAGAVFAALFGALLGSGIRQTKQTAAEFDTVPTELPGLLGRLEEALSKRRALEEKRRDAEANRESARRHEAQLRKDLGDALARLGASEAQTPAAARVEAARIEAYLGEIRALDALEESLRQTLERDQRLLSAYREEELRETVTVKPEDISQEMIERAEKEKRFYAEQARMLKAKTDGLRTELVNCRARAEDPLAIADRLAALVRDRDSGTEYFEALVLAMETLKEAGESMRGNVTPAISRNAGKLMDYISDGRYSELNVSGTMGISAVEADGMSADGELLSGGTRDAAYIALRLGLMMQIFGGELPPLILDETLCQLDEYRMRRVLALLGKLCDGDLQCLLFTCHRREGEACREEGISHELVKMRRDFQKN